MRKPPFVAMAFTGLFAYSSALQDAGKITTVSVSANAWDTRTLGSGCYPSGCLPALTRDGKQGEDSRWSCKADLVEDGANCELTYGFEEPLDIVKIIVAFYKGDERVRKLRVIVNGDYLVTLESSGETESFERFLLGATVVSTIGLEAIDLDEDEWISLTEVKLMVDEDAEAPTPCPISDESPTCSNGIVGVEGNGVCCPVGCGTCGGLGCRGRAAIAGLRADDCCSSRILASGISCEDSTAPCIVGSTVTPAPMGVTPPPTTVPTTPSTPNCTLELVGIDSFVTTLGGTTVTVSSECEISSTVIIENLHGNSTGPLYVAGVSVDPMTVYFFSPPLDSSVGLTYLEVSVVVPTGDPIIPVVIPVSSVEALGEASTTLVGIDGNASSRTSALTSPPSELPLSWDPEGLPSVSTVDIVLSIVTEEEELVDVFTFASGEENSGSYVIPADDLTGVSLSNDTVVVFKGPLPHTETPWRSFCPFQHTLYCYHRSCVNDLGATTRWNLTNQISGTIDSRRLQTEDEPLAFPKIITSQLLFWIEQPAPEVTACEDLFPDNLSRCQCFFSIDQCTGGGVPVTAFPEEFRCPASIACILDAPEEEFFKSGYISNGLSEPWISDLACPFGSCSWSIEGDAPPPLTAAELGVPTECRSWAPSALICNFHPGATFCIRTSGAPEGFANQCCYGEHGQLLVDIASGGGTIDRVQTGLFSFLEHRAQDILPFNWCCEEGDELDSWPCRMYSELRPTDAGEGAATCTAVDPSGPTVSTGEVTISADLPDFPGSLDFGLLVDISGSYRDDIARLRELAGELLEGLLTDEDGNDRTLRLALGSYSDIPDSGFGTSIDSPYILDKAFVSCSGEVDPSVCAEADRGNWITAVDNLSILSGGDGPESQAIALNRAALDWEWGDGITKILAITTDAPFHTNDDDDRYPPLDDVIDSLNAKNIKVVALKAGSAGSEMDLLAAETGGSVQETASDSSDIVEAIVEGISDSTFSSVEVQWACRDDFGASGWQHTDSGVQTDVEGGTTVEFTVSLSAPSGLEAGVTCVALIIADEVLVGGREFTMVSGTIESADITTD